MLCICTFRWAYSVGDSIEVVTIKPGGVLVQVCSAVHNQDYTLIDDYNSGLQSLLYLKAIGMPGWEGQSPPTPKHHKGKPVIDLFAGQVCTSYGVLQAVTMALAVS